MSDTLEALHDAVVAAPADRTIRLVYADALEETGDPAAVARAAFIRAQIEAEAIPRQDERYAERMVQAIELFKEYWLTWWKPVARAAGLPEPHVPGWRVRDRIAQAVGRRRRRPRNWPYIHVAADTTVYLPDYGLSFRFAGGFPEEVGFLHFDTPEDGPELVHHWGDVIPLIRLKFASSVTRAEWARVSGSHLARLADLTFDRLMPETAAGVATTELPALTRLSVNPLGANIDTIRAVVSSPPWSGLKVLTFTGRLSPEAVSGLATACTLKHLDELDLTLGNSTDLGTPLGELLGSLVRMVMQAVAFPAAGLTRWADFGPALEALAAAPWVRRLRRLAIRTTIPPGYRALFAQRHGSGEDEESAGRIPDNAVRTLVNALDWDKLDTLVLPAAVLGSEIQNELTTRFGNQLTFA